MMKMNATSYLLFLVVFGLAACSSVETERSVAERKAGAMAGAVSGLPAGFVAATGSSASIEANWLRQFGSPELETLVAEAQENNQNLQAAAAGADRARALAVKAGASLKPTVTVGGAAGGRGLLEENTSRDDFNLSAQVSWELDLWGKLGAGRRSAEAGAAVAEAELSAARHAIAATVAKAYFVALEAQLQEDLAGEQIATLEAVARIVEVQYENGLANAQDLALSQSDLAVARAAIVEIQLSRRDALRALELLLGRYPGGTIGVATGLPSLPPPPPPGLPSELLERRPDVVAAERRIASAFEETARARAARLPSLSLTGALGAGSPELSNLLSPGNVAWQAAANVLAPIIDGGARRADVAVANASQQQALANYVQTALSAFNEVETYLDQGVALARQSAQIELAAGEAERALAVAQLRHAEGEAPLLDVLTVQQRLAVRSSEAINLRRLQLAQRVNLHLALGGDW